MAVPDYSINEKLLASAKREFLEKGYERADLRTICKSAGVTTGALYKRYRGKEDMLMAIILPYAEQIRNRCIEHSNQEFAQLHQGNIEENWWQIGSRVKEIVMFMYDNMELTRLLILNVEIPAVGELWTYFITEHTKLVLEYVNHAKNESIEMKNITEDNMEMIVQSYAMAILEPIRRGYSRESAIDYLDLIDLFFDWKQLLLK